MHLGHLDRRIQFRRAFAVDDGFSTTPGFNDHGSPVWASKTDVSDGERWRAGALSANVTARFVVRWTAFTADITPADQLICEGNTYDISATKEGPGRRQWIEITAAVRVT